MLGLLTIGSGASSHCTKNIASVAEGAGHIGTKEDSYGSGSSPRRQLNLGYINGDIVDIVHISLRLTNRASMHKKLILVPE